MERPRQLLQLVVPPSPDPPRLDSWLASQAELGMSRTKVQRLIEAGEITVDGRAEAARYQLKGGETVVIIVPEPARSGVVPEALPLEILYEDDDLAVINKAAGMVTHPAAGVHSGTLVNALVHRFGELPSPGSEHRPGIIHRLDKNTSGLLLVARQENALVKLQRALERREIKRQYLAIVCGHMPTERGSIDLPIGRSPRERTRMAVVSGGRPAVTEYQLLERFRSVELHELRLQTGRTHQIRVHFSHSGHPILGDPEYGGREKWVRGIFAPERLLARSLLQCLTRQALHAYRLSLVHPRTGSPLEFEAPLPEDMAQALALLRAQPY